MLWSNRVLILRPMVSKSISLTFCLMGWSRGVRECVSKYVLAKSRASCFFVNVGGGVLGISNDCMNLYRSAALRFFNADGSCIFLGSRKPEVLACVLQ